ANLDHWGISVTANVDDFTVPEKILLAADHLDKQGQSPFSAEALIVASWQKFPKTFGLKGYAELYPDSNKILSSIMGEKGLARRGPVLAVNDAERSSSRVLTAGDIRVLTNVHRYMEDRFDRHLNLLRSRAAGPKR